jgi:amino acid transporter
MAFLLVPSVNGSYWLLTDLSTELYLFMYLFMFVSAIILKFRFPRVEGAFHIPGGRVGVTLVGVAGLAGCLLGISVGFFTPDNIDVGGATHYHWMFGGGLLLMSLPVLFFYIYRAVMRTK